MWQLPQSVWHTVVMAEEAWELWDREASRFDLRGDHGLEDPLVRRAWKQLLLPLLPETKQVVADLGCGTGTLALLLAQAGHDVHGVDFSPKMLDIAKGKALARLLPVTFIQADAASALSSQAFDVVVSRHVLWALPDPIGRPGGLGPVAQAGWPNTAGRGGAGRRELA